MFGIILVMIIVIIAGGSGSRLWPLSTPTYPKHLLKLTNEKSLLQNTYERAKLITDKIYIVSEASHIDEVYEQLPLPKERVIVEPGRRGTASCLLGALVRIKQQQALDEPIVFMHADHYIRDMASFVDALERTAQASQEYHKLVLLGLEPTHASTGLGYIERGDKVDGKQVFDVKSFKEKPDLKTAEAFLASGKYLWNMGYFVASVVVFEDTLQRFAPSLWQNYQQLLEADSPQSYDQRYLAFKNEPIDIALLEKVDNLLVVPGTFDWLDVGSYAEIHQVSRRDDEGNSVRGKVQTDHVTNSLIRNDTDTPVAVIGLDNVAVVMTKNGVVVTNKNYSQRVGDVAKKFEE